MIASGRGEVREGVIRGMRRGRAVLLEDATENPYARRPGCSPAERGVRLEPVVPHRPSPPSRHPAVHPRAPELKALAEKWASVVPAERTTSQQFLLELCDALGVARPDAGRGDYSFEYPVQTTNRKTGVTTSNWIDLYRRDHFILESKHVAGDRTAERVLGAAYGQAKGYAADIPHAPPPFLLVLNVGRTLLVWDRWGGNYGGVNAARRIDLTRLWERDEEIELLRAVWENPASLDPSVRGRQVTRDVAEKLALLSASLEKRGLESERVAKFLIRCVFTMFAEDVELLADKPFQTALASYQDDPEEFAAVMVELWRAMDEGKRFGLRKLLRFNGHFFQDAEALPLDRADLAVLAKAAEADWGKVEPTIFGTLLMRALDATERHRLGAEYTPREYVERVVRQTVDLPIRERWTPVQAEVLQLIGTGRKKDRDAALGRLREFHAWMRGLRFLDPACGSGNFLYVTLDMVKRVELEVLRAIEEITGNPELGIEEVGPWQFHGIEKKEWAREIAELTLWIGYHQFWMEHHKGGKVPEPVLQDTGTLEMRDAVLDWDEIVEVPEKSRPDPTPRIPHPVTGKLVPDTSVRLPYYEHRGARQAPWPQADFIVGNPPYIGSRRIRTLLGDGYADALHKAYPGVPDGADFVMHWWHRSAGAIASGMTLKAGLITTNSITQRSNRAVVAAAAENGVEIQWAVSDHPWVDEAGAAAVRVAMTVMAHSPPHATLVQVNDHGEIIEQQTVSRLNSDLTISADVASAARHPLEGNRGISARGVILRGLGFLLDYAEAQKLTKSDPANSEIVRPYVNGSDLARGGRKLFVIDFANRNEEQARRFPVLFDLVRDRVKSERAGKKEQRARDVWWQFWCVREGMREALEGLVRYIATTYVARHRVFQYLDSHTIADDKVVVIALDDGYALGVLSSAVHAVWALATGTRLGVGNDPTYNNSHCFDPFPFPDTEADIRTRITTVAEQLDKHRKDALARDERVTITKSYPLFVVVNVCHTPTTSIVILARMIKQSLRLLQIAHQDRGEARLPSPASPNGAGRVRAWHSRRQRPLLRPSKAWSSPLRGALQSARPSSWATCASRQAERWAPVPRPATAPVRDWPHQLSRSAESGSRGGASARCPFSPPPLVHRAAPPDAPVSPPAPWARASRTPPQPAGRAHHGDPSALHRRQSHESHALAA